MIQTDNFNVWLKENTKYSPRVIKDIISRVKRADSILPIENNDVYLFYLNNNKSFKLLTPSVRSQIRKAVTFYLQFENSKE